MLINKRESTDLNHLNGSKAFTEFNKNFNKLHLIIYEIHFKGFMNPYKKCTAKLYSFLLIDTTLASDNLLCFRKNLLKGLISRK